ncbi:unnamed protein product [Wuchereria bancrofti]|uniref:Secreted protein n=1 Tax=Wuchereria bancrofti TaxID=6293 RepID=A0A3P7DVS0_WUCBA|nr:unnamed protein product [Wuchereria bancrofti]
MIFACRISFLAFAIMTRRFFSNGQQQQQQQQGSLSGNHSRPQSVSLATRKVSGQQLRFSAADPLHSGSSSLTDQQQQDHLLSRFGKPFYLC